MVGITNTVVAYLRDMVERLTEDDWDRIEAFAKTPAYARQPELLLPEDARLDEDVQFDEDVGDEDAADAERTVSPMASER